MTLRSVELKKGYWRHGWETDDVRECESRRCVGGDGGSSDTDSDKPDSDAYCRQRKYKGPLCNLCADGHELDMVSGQCKSCEV